MAAEGAEGTGDVVGDVAGGDGGSYVSGGDCAGDVVSAGASDDAEDGEVAAVGEATAGAAVRGGA